MRMQMMAAVLAVLAAALPTEGGIAARKPEDLKKDATHIVVGKVTEVYSTTSKSQNSALTKFVAQIQIEKLEKGSGLKHGEVVYARYWDSKWIGKQPGPPGADDGYSPMPKVGDHVRAFLAQNSSQGGMGQQSDGGYDVLIPNGFEVVKAK